MTPHMVQKHLDTFDLALWETKKNQAKHVRQMIDKRVMLLQPKLARIFIKQGNAVAFALRKYRSEFSESVLDDFDSLFDRATLDSSADMWEALEQAILDAIYRGANYVIALFDAEDTFSLTDPRAEEYIKEHGADLIKGIDDVSKAQIRAIIEVALANGTSYSELARQLKAKYTMFAVGVPQKHLRSRAELIAVTELGNAYSEGTRLEALSIQDAGIPMEKYWYTIGDDRVSDGCEENQKAGWIDLDDPYPSGHMRPLRFPGCRCVEMYRRKRK